MEPRKQKKRKRRHSHQQQQPGAPPPPVTSPPTSAEAGQTSKSTRKEKRRRLPDTAHGAHEPHVGVDRINSNWLQLQAVGIVERSGRWKPQKVGQALKKGWAGGNPKSVILNESNKGIVKEKLGNGMAQSSLKTLSPRNGDCSVSKVLAMDCEMVGAGLDGKRSILARVSLVNLWGNAVYDKHVKPVEQITDYRTKVSGVRASNLRTGESFATVQKEVAGLILGRVLVGHSVRNDLKVLYLSHPKRHIRDTAIYPPLRSLNGRPRALRDIALELLGVQIQAGEHCSVEDARAAMYIYQLVKRGWEAFMSKSRPTILK